MPVNRILGLICAVSVLAVACGASTPTGPTTSGSIVNTYVAELSLAGGVTGTLTLRASNSLASLKPDIPVLSRLLAWLEPAVAAQGSTATGLLVTSNGVLIPLSGTFSGGTFNVSGGGYTIVAAVTGTSSISGTATVPGGGTVPVTPAPPPPVTSPAPANPQGTYSGTFHIEATANYVNRRAIDNVVLTECTFNVVVDGTLSLRIFNVLANGHVQSELTSSWTETEASRTCPFVALPGSPLSAGPGTLGFDGPPSSLVYGRVDQGSSGTGTVTRPESFLGAVSGNTVVMKVSRSFQFVNLVTNPQNVQIHHVSGYPTVSVTTTLTKQ